MSIQLNIRLIQLRRKAGLTQNQLAADSALAHHNICRHERGKHSPSLDSAIKYAIFYDITLDELVFGEKL